MDYRTMKRDGGFTIELIKPLKGPRGEVTQVDIKPPTLDVGLQWQRGEITSILGLLAKLADLPERLLRELTWPDVDRVMTGLGMTLPDGSLMRKDYVEGNKPMATAEEDLPEPGEDDVPDQEDPRFPRADGPVKRFSTPPKVVMPAKVKSSPAEEIEEAGGGMAMNPPETMRVVGE